MDFPAWRCLITKFLSHCECHGKTHRDGKIIIAGFNSFWTFYSGRNAWRLSQRRNCQVVFSHRSFHPIRNPEFSLSFRSSNLARKNLEAHSGGFHKWEVPNSWMVYTWKIPLKWIIWGYPHLWKPPYIIQKRNTCWSTVTFFEWSPLWNNILT